MSSSETENLSPLSRLKKKWIRLDQAERDYWLREFNSSRTSLSLRREIGFKLGVVLFFPDELAQFRRWVTVQDAVEADAKGVKSEAMSAAAGGVPASAEIRQLYRQCLRELERSAFRALLGPNRSQPLRKYAHKNVEDFYLDVLVLCVFALMEEMTPRNGLN